MTTQRSISDEPMVTIGTNKYWLSLDPKTGEALYQTITRPYQHISQFRQQENSDNFEIAWSDWSGGLGEDFYASTFLSSVKGKLYLPPSFLAGADTRNGYISRFSGLLTSSMRYAFEEQDANGTWYLFILAPQQIYKINISSVTPYIETVYGPKLLTGAASAPFTTSDYIGQPVKAYDATDSGQRWFLPLNNANRIMVMDTVSTQASVAYTPAQTLNGAINATVTTVVVSGTAVANGDVLIVDLERMYVRSGGGTSTLVVFRAFANTVAASHSNGAAVTHATADTWRVFTTVTDGASHFRMMPDGTVYRAIYDGVGGASASPTQAKISLLATGADLEANANWAGAEFGVALPSSRIRGLANLEDLCVILKDDGAYNAVKNPDGTLYFRSLLPDAQFQESVTVENQTFSQPTVWHGKLMIPTARGFWRHQLWSSLPVGPDAIADVTGDEAGPSGIQTKYGAVCAVADAGTWIYATYNWPVSTFSYNWSLLAGKERGQDNQQVGEIQWYPVLASANDSRAQLNWVQRNGANAPRVWVGTDGGSIYYFSCAQDGNPFLALPGGNAALFGDASSTYDMWTTSIAFPSLVLLREVQLFIEHGSANTSWSLQAARDGGSAAAVGAALTATGSIFWTARTADTCRRLQINVRAINNSSYIPALWNQTPRLVRAVLYGSLLPNVNDDLLFSIDVTKTAVRRGNSPKQIRTELKNDVNSGALVWVDVHGFSGNILLQEVQESPLPFVAGLEGRQVLGLRARLLKYSTTF